MNIEFDFNDPNVPAVVKEWYLEQQQAQIAKQLATKSFEEERGHWTVNRHPLAPEPLTLEDGSVLHRAPVIYDEPLPPDKARSEFLKKQLGLE